LFCYAALLTTELFVINDAEAVERPLHAADFVQGLMHAVLAGVGTQPMQDQRR
jgi:hypothetical protein